MPSLRTLKDDFLASLVVFLVALPLCMGIALASGIPPERAAATGILTGIIAGLVVGAISGSPLQVSGPAAGLSVLILELINGARNHFLERHDLASLDEAGRAALQGAATEYALAALGVTVLFAGLIQLAAGIFRCGQWFRAVSPAVIQGMLAGIGVLIFASQFHVMIDDRPRDDGLANLLAIPESIWNGLVPHEGASLSSLHAGYIGILTIASIVLWKRFGPTKVKFLPAPLMGVLVATGVSAALALNIKHVSMPENILEVVNLPTPAVIADVWSWSLLISALTVALIASAESLLCAAAVDQLHQGPRTRFDRELTAQGVGNTLCGLLGVLPMTGVIVRSAANVEAGAKSRLSACLHGAWLLLFVVALPTVLELIPTAALAAVLVYTGYKLVNVRVIRSLWLYGTSEAAIYFATLIGIVSLDLLRGVLIGIALSALKLAYSFSRLEIRIVPVEGSRRTALDLRGAATFIRLPKLAAALEQVPPSTELHVHLEHLDYIDHACLDLIMNWEKQHRLTGGTLVMDWDTLTARFREPHIGVPAGPAKPVVAPVCAVGAEREYAR